MSVHRAFPPSMAHHGAIQLSSPQWPPSATVPAIPPTELIHLLGALLGLDDILLCRLDFDDTGHYLYRDPTDGLIYVERRACAVERTDARPVVATSRDAHHTADLVLPHTLYTRSFRETHDLWLSDSEVCDLFRSLASRGTYPSGYALGLPVTLTFRGERFGS